VSGLCIRVFVLWALFLFANAALDRAEGVVKEADVVVIASSDADLRLLSHAWIVLRRVDEPNRVERILWSLFDPPLHAGKPVLLEVRPGFFGLPWIALLTVDDVRANLAVLRTSPTSAEAWKMLIKGYAIRAQVPELVNATVQYTRLHPVDHDFPEIIALGLGMGGFCDGMHAVLSRFVGRRTDYEFYTHMGYALACMKRRDEAMKYLDKAIAMEPRNWWAYYHAGYMFFDGQKFEQAKPYFAKVLAIRPIPDVARDMATIDKILALKRAREQATRN
jgi:tetratricopeptide (TPR) repeat protein